MFRTVVRKFASSSVRLVPTFNVAIVGTGPAGFYTAHHLLNKSSPKDQFVLNVDFFEKNPVPYGLSRYGVAPDHPEVKNCEEYLDNIMSKYGNNSSTNDGQLPQQNSLHRVRFFGNVEIGKDITLQDLEQKYHSIILSYGCTHSDNKLLVPGADLQGIISAREFVSWYNGSVDFYESGLKPPPLDKVDTVTIIGNGNVALDVARVLLADPDTHWTKTDISVSALEHLRKSTVKKVNIVARRGILESAFSNKEIRELLELSNGTNIRFLPIDEKLTDEIRPNAKSLNRIDKRKFQLLDKYSKLEQNTDIEVTKSWELIYLRSPIEFISNNLGSVSETKFVLNKLEKDSFTGSVKVSKTSETEIIKNELVILSIGYQGIPLEEFEQLDISFDKNRILNNEGRILSSSNSGGESLHKLVYRPGWYTSGWIKNGPKGVIATTMMESFETADSVLEDLSNNIKTHGPEDLKVGVNNIPEESRIVSWQDWIKIDQFERKLGEEHGKERIKIESKEELLQIAHDSQN